MTAPLTTAKLGSARCVGCERLFSETQQPTVDVEVDEEQRNRYGGFSGPRRVIRVVRRWHVACREDFERVTAEVRDEVAADHEKTMRDLCAASGIDYDTFAAGAQR